MKRLAGALIALLIASLSFPACPARAEDYGVIFTGANPIPDIAESVRPAVVQVIALDETWDHESGAVTSVMSYGSGVYIDARGYVVTNYHIISGATYVEILALDGLRLRASDVYCDAGTDLAVLRLPAPLDDVKPVPLGDSDELRIGELAIVIGNPGVNESVFFGTVTAGIISALDREDVSAGNFESKVNVIQLDAAINAGNSGGALLNAKGELTGIPTLKLFYESGVIYEGLGFAIPINTAKPIIADLIAYGYVIRPRMGVAVVDFEGPDEPHRGYPPAGVQVTEVDEGGPGQEAGLLAYDIITSVAGVRVKSFSEMSNVLDTYASGTQVEVVVYRCYDPLTGKPLRAAGYFTYSVTLEVID